MKLNVLGCQGWRVAGLAILLAAGRVAGADPLVLVKDGKAVAAIVQPAWEKPTAPAKELDAGGQSTAASAAPEAEYRRLSSLREANVTQPSQALQGYVKRISGASLPVVVDGSPEHKAWTGPQIHLGRTVFVEGAMPDLRKKDKEHVVLKRAGDKLVIACGGDPLRNRAGMNFAVSTFLNDVLGVRHYLPEPEGVADPLWTLVPKTNTLSVETLDYAHTPDYLSRNFSLGNWPHEKTAWTVRNRIAWGGRYHIPHNIGKLLKPSKYAEKHPEFYPLLNGKRFIPSSWAEKNNKLTKDWQPCLSNPGVVAALVEEARAFLDVNPEADLVSMAHNDNYGWCECEECVKANGGVKYNADGRINFSDLYFKALNAICTELEKTHPGILVGAMVYQNGTHAVPSFKLHPNIVVMQSVDFSLFHAKGVKYEGLKSFIGEWGKAASHLAIHAWHVDFDGPLYPRLELKSTQEYLAFHRQSGGIGYHGEEYPNFGLEGPKTWITAQLLWDVRQDLDKLLQQFCDDCFGPAGVPMRGYFDTLENAWNKNTAHYNPYWYLSAPIDVVLPAATIDECAGYLDQALALAGTDVQRRRVRFFREVFAMTRSAAGVARSERTCEELVRERELTPGMFAELTATLNEVAFGREALAQYIERLSADPAILMNGSKLKAKYEANGMDPLVGRVASTLITRLAREEAGRNPTLSQEAFTAALRKNYAALSEPTRARIAGEPTFQGLAWQRFEGQAEDFLGAVAKAPKLAKAPVLDGVLAADEWAGAPVLTGFRNVGDKRTVGKGAPATAQFQTEVRLGYDDQALYVAYRLTEEDVAQVTAVYDKRDAAIWNDDSADFGILPPGTDGALFNHYIVNANDAIFDARDGAEWNGGVTVKTGIDKQAGAWVIEAVIPWKDFGRKAEPGEVWRAQFGRSDWKSGRCTSTSWAPTASGLNNSDFMGIVLFE